MSEDAGGSLPRRPGDVRGAVQCGRGHHQAAGWYEVTPDPRTAPPVSFCCCGGGGSCEALGWLVQLLVLMLMFCFPPQQNSVPPEPTTVRPDLIQSCTPPTPPLILTLCVVLPLKLQSHHQRSHHEVERPASGLRRSLRAAKPSNSFVSPADIRPPSGLSRTWSAAWRWGALKGEWRLLWLWRPVCLVLTGQSHRQQWGNLWFWKEIRSPQHMRWKEPLSSLMFNHEPSTTWMQMSSDYFVLFQKAE